MESWEVVHAAVTVGQLAWRAVLLFQQLSQVHAEAQALRQKTVNLCALVRSVESHLRLRKQRRGSEPASTAEVQIGGTIKVTLESCKRCLNDLIHKLDPLANPERYGLSARFRFMYSANVIQRQERDIETNVVALGVLLGLLQLIEQGRTHAKMEQFEQTFQQANAHLRSVPQVITPSQIPVFRSSTVESLVPENDAETERLSIKSLKQCIRTAQTLRLPRNPTTPPCPDISDRLKQGDSSNGSKAEADTDDEDKGSCDIAAENDGLGIRRVVFINKSVNADTYPIQVLESEMHIFGEHANRDFDAQNFVAAERNQQEAISCGERLGERGYRPFADRDLMLRRLADIYKKQDKYDEAIRVIQQVLQGSSAAAESLKDTLHEPTLWFEFAELHYLKSLKYNDRNLSAAVRDLNTAADFAISECYTKLEELLCQGIIDEEHQLYLDCVMLVVRILEKKGDTPRAEAWRRLLPRRPPSTFTVTNTKSRTSQKEGQDPEAPREEIMKQLMAPGRTQLINAIQFNLSDEFQQLLEAGEDVEGRCKDGLTPIMHAAICQHTEECGCETAIRKLKDRNADINATAGAARETALHRAVGRLKDQMVTLLLEMGADINASAPNTPLAIAVKANQASMTELLLQRKADVKVVDADNLTLLHHAVLHNSNKALLVLLDCNCKDSLGIDLEARSSGSLTALMDAARKAGEPQSYDLAVSLISHGADVNVKDLAGRSALSLTIDHPRSANREKFAKLLIENGADVGLVPDKLLPRVKQYPEVDRVLKLRRKDSGEASMTCRGSTETPSSRSTPKNQKVGTNKLNRWIMSTSLVKSRNGLRVQD